MRFSYLEAKDKTGQTIGLRNAEITDANDLIKFLKRTAEETPFLIKEPDEIKLTLNQEENFIKNYIEEERGLMLIATLDGKHIGNCSLSGIGPHKRYAHRCSIAIALYREFCGRGIGTIMMQTILNVAKELGYEQAELEVIADNESAVCLYQKSGFKKYGVLPDNMKYADGRYADAYWMMKKLV